MKRRPDSLFAVLALAYFATVWCSGSPPVLSAASPSSTSSATKPMTAPAPDSDVDARRRRLLELWNQAGHDEATTEAPLYRSRAGSSLPYRSLPDGAPTGATLVSVAHAETGLGALRQIARAANVRISAAKPGMFHAQQPGPFSLDLDRKPLLEAIYETCSRAGWTIQSVLPVADAAGTAPTSNEPLGTIILEPAKATHGSGFWSTTGPFLYEVVCVEHSVDVPIGQGGDEADITLRTWTEPKLRAFNVAAGLVVNSAVDEQGNILQPRPTEANDPWTSPSGETKLRLGLPRNCGRRIARLFATDHCFIQRASHRFDLPWGQVIADEMVEGMNVSMTTKSDPGDFQCHCTLKVARGRRSKLDWGDLQLAISDLRPRLLDSAGTPMRLFASGVKCAGDQSTVEYSWIAGDRQGRPRTPGKIVLELPTDVKWLNVPVELVDLPLP